MQLIGPLRNLCLGYSTDFVLEKKGYLGSFRKGLNFTYQMQTKLQGWLSEGLVRG